MTELLAGSPGVITAGEWIGVLVIGIVFAVIGGVIGWFLGGDDR